MSTMTQGLTEQQKLLFNTQYNGAKKDSTVAIILAVLLRCFGVDRFYVGDVGIGLLKLFTGGLCGILWLVDIFLISGKVAQYNRAKAQEIIQTLKISG